MSLWQWGQTLAGWNQSQGGAGDEAPELSAEEFEEATGGAPSADELSRMMGGLLSPVEVADMQAQGKTTSDMQEVIRLRMKAQQSPAE